MARPVKFWLSLAVLAQLFASSVAKADDLKDPTRPPNLAFVSTGELDHVPVLQSVLISNSRKFAIIDGKTVNLNSKFGEQTLIKLSETEVVLRKGKERQVLKLYPMISKRMINGPKK